MSLKEIIKNNQGISIIIILIIFIIAGKNYIDKIGLQNDKEFRQSEFKGIITKKYRQKGGNGMFYRDLKSNKEIEISPSDELDSIAKIGDTIEKIPNTNNCVIQNIKKKKIVKCKYEDKEY